jgi:hypothetical protein
MDKYQLARVLGITVFEVEKCDLDIQKGNSPGGFMIVIGNYTPNDILQKIAKVHGRNTSWISVTKDML